jgi:hypothetical protein
MNQLEIFKTLIIKKTNSQNWETPDVEYLNECFFRDRENGFLTWKERPAHHFKNLWIMHTTNKIHAGKRVTRLSHKGKGLGVVCRSVMINGVNYKEQRIHWKMEHGVDSKLLIDHIDGNRLNNAIKNLREATYLQNARNTEKHRAKLSNYSNYQMAFV